MKDQKIRKQIYIHIMETSSWLYHHHHGSASQMCYRNWISCWDTCQVYDTTSSPLPSVWVFSEDSHWENLVALMTLDNSPHYYTPQMVKLPKRRSSFLRNLWMTSIGAICHVNHTMKVILSSILNT